MPQQTGGLSLTFLPHILPTRAPLDQDWGHLPSGRDTSKELCDCPTPAKPTTHRVLARGAPPLPLLLLKSGACRQRVTPALPSPYPPPSRGPISRGRSAGVLAPTVLVSLGGGLHLPEAPRAGFAAPAGPRPALFSALGWQGPPAAPKPFCLRSGAANQTGGPSAASPDPAGTPRPLNSLGVRARGPQSDRVSPPQFKLDLPSRAPAGLA